MYVNFFLQTLRHAFSERPKALISGRILPEGATANAVGRTLGIPSIVFAHGEEIHRMRADSPVRSPRKITHRVKRRALWRAFRGAEGIVANSRFTANLLLDGGVAPHRIAVIHPGTDPAKFRPSPRDEQMSQALGLGGKKVILTVGRLTPRKGQDMAIRAMPKILRCVPDAVYVIAGTGDYESRLRTLVDELHLGPAVRFVGAAENALLPRLYVLADVFVMPNRETQGLGNVEGFGIVFLEANACEVPVIGGRSGGVPDAIVDGQTGLLVEGDSVEAIAQSVIRILTDEAYARQLGRNGRERVCRELTWDHSARRIKEFIESLEATGRLSRVGTNAKAKDGT